MNSRSSACAPPPRDAKTSAPLVLTTYDPQLTTRNSRLVPSHKWQDPVVSARRPRRGLAVQTVERGQTPEIDASRRVVQHCAQLAIDAVPLFGIGLDCPSLDQCLRLWIVVA